MKDELLARIENLEIDKPGVSLPFSARLARENGWSPDFARRVVGEYKRFVYLALRAGHPVTPSEEVDEAWHLHLCYTRSYWDEMCGKVLGRPLHHGPTEGGAEEDRKFGDWYGRTLESYRRIFGEEPPPDIWPPGEERFAGAVRKIDSRSYWVLPKRTVRKAAWVSLGLAAVPALAGCGRVLGLAGSGELVCFGIFVGLMVLLLVLAFRGGGRGGSGGGGCGGIFGCGSGGDSSGCGGGGCGGGGD